jgi:hypothetical protein
MTTAATRSDGIRLWVIVKTGAPGRIVYYVGGGDGAPITFDFDLTRSRKYPTREDAEAEAFEVVARDSNFIGRLWVEEKSFGGKGKYPGLGHLHPHDGP